MTLNEFQRVSYKLLGGVVSRSFNVDKLATDLRRSRLNVRAEAYLAMTLAISIMSMVFGLLASWFVFFLLLPRAMPDAPSALVAFFPVVPLMMGLLAYVTLVSTPGSKAKERAKKIDQRIPYALNYIAAMASAGVNMDQVFKSLADQGKVYGECAREADAIYRDMVYFGKDSTTAMRRGIERTPSDKWAEFLQGAITTVTSGGDLQNYFAQKAQRYMWDNRQEQKQFVDMMGLMAETYVTAAVAGPLFLIVMMAIMGMLGGDGPQQLYLIIYLLLPVANIGFTYALYAMTPEV